MQVSRVLGLTALTFVPVVLLALFAPQYIENNAFLVAGVGELAFLQAYSKRLVEMKQASGTIPYRVKGAFPSVCSRIDWLPRNRDWFDSDSSRTWRGDRSRNAHRCVKALARPGAALAVPRTDSGKVSSVSFLPIFSLICETGIRGPPQSIICSLRQARMVMRAKR